MRRTQATSARQFGAWSDGRNNQSPVTARFAKRSQDTFGQRPPKSFMRGSWHDAGSYDRQRLDPRRKDRRSFIAAVVVATTTQFAPLFNIGYSVLEGADAKTVATAYALLTGIALGLLGLAGIAGALLMSAAATVAYRGGLQPRWTVVLVVVGAVIAAIGTWMFFFPILLVVLWVLVASVRGTIHYRRGVLHPLP